jgi:hypothetical protein
VLSLLLSWLCLGQAPAGTIAGVVRDPSGAFIAGAQVHAINRASGQVRKTLTDGPGEYSLPALVAGEYDVSAEAPGFQRSVRAATVEVGSTTTADFEMRVGDAKDTITVDAASPQMHYDAAGVAGLILRSQVEDLPLNGRSFLELAKLEPGVQAPSSTNRNRTLLPILGAPGSNVSGTRVTVDGGSITSVGMGGSQMGFSQEVVQEFQVATVNFDLSTGTADAGAINIVTRSGGNDLHATAVRLRHGWPHSTEPHLLFWKLGTQRAAGSSGDHSAGSVRSVQRHHSQPPVRRPAQRAPGRPHQRREHAFCPPFA